MFSSSPNYTKLKTHLRLAINRLKLLEKKKAELAQKSRKEISDFIVGGKAERAKIRVEHIIREDYLVEAMEIVEMYCDLLLARFGLITQMKELDEGLSEAIASLIWVAPRLQADIQELKIISDLLTAKYGKPYADSCRNDSESVSIKLKHKLSIQSPPKKLVEKYLIEIASCFNVEYEPDPQIMHEENDSFLIDLGNDRNNLGGGGGGVMPIGFIGYPQAPTLPPSIPFNYPPSMEDNASAPPPQNIPFGAPFSYNIRHAPDKESNTDFNLPSDMLSPDDNLENNINKPTPQPRSKMPSTNSYPELPELPSVPLDNPSTSTDIDFDDLTKRFEALKKKK
ncbi:PREDICTED: IST1 homolog [Nicrophorus vespilloides]|uniref:IST1 homolog n=1 Tax=Nicrophorus vespilloides TaxID=110193 RepID=A0ABM1MPN0_NICVS|nr:PREDICTED: IST1 homolog [Nicrophorus vespilloides]